MKAPLLALVALSSIASAGLEVHEWGTFTTLSDSSGSVIRWYSPASEHSALPAFVKQNPLFNKSTMMATVRMETPVLYFYPDQPMRVQVHAEFNHGGITEVYPSSIAGRRPFRPGPNGSLISPTFWEGKLLAPDNRKALAMIPTVPADERGAHYAAAREVPDAWIFHHQAEVTNPKTKEVILRDEADKFIFYRGAGDFPMHVTFANSKDGRIHILNTGKHDITPGVLLEVRGEKGRWNAMPLIPRTGKKPTQMTTFPGGPWSPIDQVEAELTDWFQDTLTNEGLTADEAAAMVKTWHGSWFRETGLRAFTLMPRERVDEVLPLVISPSPDSLTRVFVHRHELIRSEREQELASLVSDPRIPVAKAAAKLEQLELGRFSDAAMTRASSIIQAKVYERYQSLKATLEKQ